MDISRFRAQLPFDGARPNLFRVIVNLPANLQGLVNQSRESFGGKFSMMCRTAAIPQSMLGAVPVPYQGREIFLAGNRTFADWTVTLYNDEDYTIRRTFELWMAALNSHVGNVRRPEFASATSYTADCIVEQLGKTGEDVVIARYRMENAFPIDLAEISLDWGSNDQLEEYQVTFKFDNWVNDDFPPSVA